MTVARIEDYLRDRLDGDGWADPTPIGDTGEQPSFPIETLPGWIARHVAQVAEEFQFPPDLPAQLAIAALSVIAARRAEVVVQGTWREPLNTYTATAMPPSAAKSPAFRAMLGCLDRWEAALIERSAPQRDQVETERAILEKVKAKAISAGETTQALIAGDQIRALPECPVPRLMADDATPEKLTEMLGEQGGRMALVSTEGGVFDLMTGRYSDKSNLNVYLQAWSGDPIRVDRIGRKSSVVMNPALTMGITVQPDVIAKLADTPELAGRGLTARIMYSFPPSNVGYRDMGKPPSIDPGVAAQYEGRLLELAEWLDDGPPRDILIAPEAREAYVAWRQDMEGRCRPGGDLYDMQQWVTKLGSTVARLAGLLTLAEGHMVVDRDVMERAITVGYYWESHARVAYAMWIGDVATTHADAVLEWIAATELKRFTLRDVCRAKRSYTAEDAVAALEVLVDNSWIRVAGELPLVAARRGVPSPELVSHPRLSHFRNNHVPMSHMSLKTNSITSSSSSQNGDGDGDVGTYGTYGTTGQAFDHTPKEHPSVDNLPPDYEHPFS